MQQIKESHRVQEHIKTLSGDRHELEKTLSQSRQALLEKLREKQLLEKDLSYHTELERRLLEKQRVEELLFEKTRFEQELKRQKETLRTELDSFEKRLTLREGSGSPAISSHVHADLTPILLITDGQSQDRL